MMKILDMDTDTFMGLQVQPLRNIKDKIMGERPYIVKAGHTTKVLQGEHVRESGFFQNISWHLLAKILKDHDAGPVWPDQEIVQIEVSEDGIKYYFEHTKD